MNINRIKKTKKITSNIILATNFLNIRAMNNNKNNKCSINNIKSDYILKNIFDFHNNERKKLNLIKYNKNLQRKLNININNYRRYRYIIFYVEGQNKNVKFINFYNKKSNDIIIKNTNVPRFKRILVNTYNLRLMGLFFKLEGILSVRIIKLFNDNSLWNGKQYNLCNLFHGCTNLKQIIFQNDNKFLLENGNEMFKDCENLEKIEGLENLETYIVKNIRELFMNCRSLTSIKGIEKWKLKYVKNMSSMFENCTSLTTLPDISKWKFRTYYEADYLNMSGLFKNCSSLISLPDISNWNTNRVDLMNEMFYGCKSLTILPDISKWDTSWLETTESMFENCYSLIEVPDINKWPSYRLKCANNMFKNCYNLVKIFDLKYFNYYCLNTNNTMFINCISLLNKYNNNSIHY